MSDVNLLLFGCVVSFIVVAGAYVYVREGFTVDEHPRKDEAGCQDAVPEKLRDVA